MDVLDKVRNSFKTKHPNLRFTDTGTSITVHASKSSGFDIGIAGNSASWTVNFEGWHEHSLSDESALELIAFGFSDHCRLKVSLRGPSAHSWTLESLRGGEWVEGSTTGLLLFPFWRTARIEYRQNALITKETPANRETPSP